MRQLTFVWESDRVDSSPWQIRFDIFSDKDDYLYVISFIFHLYLIFLQIDWNEDLRSEKYMW